MQGIQDQIMKKQHLTQIQIVEDLALKREIDDQTAKERYRLQTERANKKRNEHDLKVALDGQTEEKRLLRQQE